MKKHRAEVAAQKKGKRKKRKTEKVAEEGEEDAGGEDTGPRKVDYDEEWDQRFDEEDDFYDRTHRRK